MADAQNDNNDQKDKNESNDGQQPQKTSDGRANNARNLRPEDRSRGGQAAAAQNARDDQGRFYGSRK